MNTSIKLIAITFICLPLALVSIEARAAVELSEDECTRYSATINRVTDGDTLVARIHLGFGVTLDKAKIRMYGINTPESRTRNPLEKEAGLAAKNRLVEILAASNSVELCVNKDKPRGKFGRVLAIVFADGISVNKTLVEEGHATPYFGGKRKPWAPPPAALPLKSPILPLLGALGYLG